jgi:hypothetical protein
MKKMWGGGCERQHHGKPWFRQLGTSSENLQQSCRHLQNFLAMFENEKNVGRRIRTPVSTKLIGIIALLSQPVTSPSKEGQLQ